MERLSVKILAVSDVVLPQMQDPAYLHRTFSDVDLLVSCGDMPACYLDLLGSALNVPLFFVRGNHDDQYKPHQPGGDDLHLHVRSYKDYWFAGLEGSISYSRKRVQYTEEQMFRYVLRMMPRLLMLRAMRGFSVDVLVAHSPPKGIHDIPDDRAHRGFHSFRYLIKWARPRYFIHGHVDTWDCRKKVNTVFAKTTVINVNPYKVLVLDEE
jgi:Icc-related predicted phosphoesterase